MPNESNVNKCSIWWCGNGVYAHGYCEAHYKAIYRFGSPYGKHIEVFETIDQLAAHARKLANAVLATAGLLNEDCPFCHESITHAKDCATFTAKRVLEMTDGNINHDPQANQDPQEARVYDNMLSALELLVDRHDDQMLTKEEWDNARTAILRAKRWSRNHG